VGEVAASERFTAGADRVEGVGLGAVASGRTVRAVELDHQLVTAVEVSGEPGAVAAGALDRPGSKSRVSIRHRDELGVAVRVGVDGAFVEHGAGGRVDHRGGVGVLVGVDTDDDVDDLCQHGHAFSLPGRTCGSGPVRRSAGL
jgi:hypothetical protein